MVAYSLWSDRRSLGESIGQPMHKILGPKVRCSIYKGIEHHPSKARRGMIHYLVQRLQHKIQSAFIWMDYRLLPAIDVFVCCSLGVLPEKFGEFLIITGDMGSFLGKTPKGWSVKEGVRCSQRPSALSQMGGRQSSISKPFQFIYYILLDRFFGGVSLVEQKTFDAWGIFMVWYVFASCVDCNCKYFTFFGNKILYISRFRTKYSDMTQNLGFHVQRKEAFFFLCSHHFITLFRGTTFCILSFILDHYPFSPNEWYKS